MGSGGKSKKEPPIPAAVAPTFDLNALGSSGIGYGWTPNTYTQQGKPAWMQGYFDDPSWGRAAADPSVQLTHEMLGPQGINATNQAIYNNAPEALRGNIQPVPQQPQAPQAQQGGIPFGAVPPSMNPKSSIGMDFARAISEPMMAEQQMLSQNPALAAHYQAMNAANRAFPTSSQGG